MLFVYGVFIVKIHPEFQKPLNYDVRFVLHDGGLEFDLDSRAQQSYASLFLVVGKLVLVSLVVIVIPSFYYIVRLVLLLPFHVYNKYVNIKGCKPYRSI